SATKITLAKSSKITFIKSPDSIRYFFTEQKNKKVIFSIESGKKLLSADYDQVESLTKNIFLVTKGNKKGLLDSQGKLILPVAYDALVVQAKNQLSLLQSKKFGLYDLVTGKLIKPVFERNISFLDAGTLIAYKDNHYGLIDWTAQPLTAFEFDEIRPWKKNVIWAKKGYEWTLLDFRQPADVLRHIKTFRVISDKPEEKIALVQQEDYYGVISNERGIVIPTSFSFVTNLGTEDDPLYFTSKEVEEAGIVVVIYYDREGKLLRKQVYEEEEYVHILCPEE
ncbi:MAG TPA: WG repeat-containing protein, partial [Cyclobacteriaceae bacterium]|nr:WG repeat-containing protein [Cyclobacteriaceae bacterium]